MLPPDADFLSLQSLRTTSRSTMVPGSASMESSVPSLQPIASRSSSGISNRRLPSSSSVQVVTYEFAKNCSLKLRVVLQDELGACHGGCFASALDSLMMSAALAKELFHRLLKSQRAATLLEERYGVESLVID